MTTSRCLEASSKITSIFFFFKKREKPGKKEINSAYWNFMPGFSSIDVWRRLGRACLGADRTPRRPPSQGTQVAAGRESAEEPAPGPACRGLAKRRGHFLLLCRRSGTPCALERVTARGHCKHCSPRTLGRLHGSRTGTTSGFGPVPAAAPTGAPPPGHSLAAPDTVSRLFRMRRKNDF